ncbi:DNA polymerase III subunit alpha [Pontiella agarivorans]|uniref:DNA polymerase III subunit alpha n=1 Tax=Pontiella agarivorans TaxID=3038953 RepID=A0ABU5MUU8_9BACT|nr:DNA polymerase III subunit alpha [Pontiella agarivorans]MDZ8117999.1 DNA polymerase III subunit alpha [Pontiella agarivorans]
MSSVPFAHLHFHTCYSLLDSTAKVKPSVQAAADMGMQYLAMTDHAVLYGAVEFYKACYGAGIKPIIGCDMYVARHGIGHRETMRDNMSLVLLAETQEGYANLVKLVSIAHLEGMYYKPRIDKELLKKYSKGLIALSGDMRGEVAEACRNDDVKAAIELALEYSDIMGKGNFFLELFDHGLDEEKTIRENLLRVAEATGLPIVATNDVHYIRQEHADAHDVLTCLQRGYLVADPNRYRYHGDQYYMKSGEEMAELFNDHPEAISNSIEIAQRCNVEFFFPEKAEDLHFPFFPLPEGFTSDYDYLVHLGKEGLRKLYGIEDLDHPKNDYEKTINERFYYEVSVIKKTNYINYFLVVADFIQWARAQGIPVGPGRGSGAGSLLAYSLAITTIEPLKYNLIFERFLNPDRVSPPDFDIDFCPTKRQDVIQYVREKYGEECCGQIITFGTLGAKTLMRDLGRVLEIPLPYCDRLAKMIPDTPGTTMEKALAESPEFKQATSTEPDALRIMKYAKLLEGLPRHTGMHAAGVVIGEKPLIEIIPLTKEAKEGLTVVQFEKGPTEEIGLLKMDFLGLKNLTIIYEACDLIKRNHGVEIDPEKLDIKDAKAFELLARGDTVGVFQLESGGMRDTLRQVAPDCIEDIIAILALYRPGPMQFIPTYIKRKHGQETVEYDHPILEPILEETNGIIVYQEQIQQAAQKLAGFSLGQGDILRRAMGKKKPEVMAEQRGKFVEGCKETNGIDEKLANKIFDNITEFAKYGFNKSHSTAYGFVTYQTAWLKAHYPAEFMAALLSGEMGNSDKLTQFIGEAKEMGIDVLPPSVNESIGHFNAVQDGGGIRFGLAAIKGVGEGVVEEIVKERDQNGPFLGLMDFCARITSANKKVIESLIRSGAFDFSSAHRAQLFNGIDIAIGRAAEALKDKASGQVSMFDMMAGSEAEESSAGSDDELPEVKPWSESDMLAAEKELIGFFISGHPLARFEWVINKFALKKVAEVGKLLPGTRTRCGGMVTEMRKLFTKKDQKPMAVFRIEGLEGSINAIIFPGPYEQYGHLLTEDATLMFGGTMLDEEGGDPKLQIMEIFPLDSAASTFCDRVSIHLPEIGVNEQVIGELKSTIQQFRGPIPLHICIEFAEGQKIFLNTDHDYKVRPCDKLVHGIEQVIGEGTVFVAAKSDALKNPPKPRKWERKKT